jgi:hypothetical protein
VTNKLTLSSFDFLGLADNHKVAMVDLADIGYSGILFVRDLTSAEQQKIMSVPKNSRVKQYSKEKAFEFDASMFATATADFLRFGLVTDRDGGAVLERAFDALPDDEDYLTFPASELVQMWDDWMAELKNVTKVRDRLDALPNAVTNEIVRAVKEISGMNEDKDNDVLEEKKAS